MSKALIIGAGGVAGVVIHKCCQNSEVFTEICIASRTKSKCDKFKDELIRVVGIGKTTNDWFLYTPLLKRVLETAMLNSKENKESEEKEEAKK